VLKIFCEVAVAANYKSTGICINDEFTGELDVFFRYLLCFYFVPVLNEVGLFFKGVVDYAASTR